MAPATCLVCRRAIRAAPVASGARVRPTPGPAARRAALRTGAALATGLLLGGRQARAEDSPPGYTDATRALIDASEALVQGEVTDYSGWQQVRKVRHTRNRRLQPFALAAPCSPLGVLSRQRSLTEGRASHSTRGHSNHTHHRRLQHGRLLVKHMLDTRFASELIRIVCAPARSLKATAHSIYPHPPSLSTLQEWDASYKKKYGKHSTSHLLAIRVSGMVGGQVAKNVAQDSPFTPESTLYNPDFARELITRARTALDNDE